MSQGAPDTITRLNTVLEGRYRVEREIGSGGMATVYLAHDLKHDRQVALKVLEPHLTHTLTSDRFLLEIKLASNLTHPHILPLFDSGEADGLLYYVMPHVEGESLRERLEREKQLPVEDAVRITREIADALAFAHDHGVVHRDVKPGNILLEAGHAVLADFGIAKALAEAGDIRATATGMSLGTPTYMSPEQAGGENDLDGRSDQYALGCVLYEMLAGKPPFSGSNVHVVVRQHMMDEPTPIGQARASVPESVVQALDQSLAKARADRFRTAADFGKALDGISVSQAHHFLLPTAPARRRRALRWTASALSVVVLAAAGSLVFLGSTNEFGFQERDWILITDFQNGTGETVFDRSLDNALAVGLQQSQHLNLFPKTRIAQTLQRMLREDTGEVNEELGQEIAQRENIRLLVVPSIDRIDQTYVLSVRIVEPTTGDAVLSRSVQAEGSGEVLPALDNLARGLRRALGESRYSISRRGVRLGAATTPSLEALEAWSEAEFHWGGRRYEEAMTLYRRAIELDSSFAMAHADLGGALFFQGDRVNGVLHFEEALSLTDRVTERERLWIRAEIENAKENYEDAIDAYNIYLTRYPDALAAWFRLGYAQMRGDHPADAVHAFDQVVALDPENAAGFINLATSYNLLNQREDATQQYLRAFELAPEWITSGNLNHEFGFNYVELGDLESAGRIFRRMLEGDDGQRAGGHRSLALMKMYEGRYGEAREHLRQAAILQGALEHGLSELRDRLFLAAALWANGSAEAAEAELAAVRELARPASVHPNWLAYVGKQHARIGLVAEAEGVLQDAILRFDESVQADRAPVALLRGEVALARGDPLGALGHLQTAYALAENAYYLESLAHGLYSVGDLDAARDRYLTLLAEPELGWEAQEYWMISHYRLGQIYEEQGDVPNALRYYRRLLDIWGEGDPDLVTLQHATEKLEELDPGG